MSRLVKLAGCLLLSVLMGCNPSPSSNNNVVCTTTMITDVVSIIAGNKLNVVGLMGPGVDPHLYKASAKDVRLLNDADVIFYNGLHLESKMEEFLSNLKDKKTVVAIADSVDKSQLIKVDDNLYDPHIWFDLDIFSISILEIKSQLVKKYPQFKEDFETNYKNYMTQLADLKKSNIKLINTLKDTQRILVTAHDAFSYFAKAYNFEVIALQGISTQAEAGLADVDRLVRIIVEKQIPAIFVESSISPRQIKAVQDAVHAKGWNVKIGGELYSDALGEQGTKVGTYLGMFEHNVETIVSGLLLHLDYLSK